MDGKVHRTAFALFTPLLADFKQIASPLDLCFSSCSVEIKMASKEL